jgi:hypothetical protein
MNLRVDEESLRVRVEQDEARQLFLEGQLQRELAFPGLGARGEGWLRLLLLCPPEEGGAGEVKRFQQDFPRKPVVAVTPEGREAQEAGVLLCQGEIGQEPGLTMKVSRSLLRGILSQLGLLAAGGAAQFSGLQEQELMGSERPKKSKKQLEIKGSFEVRGVPLDLSFEVDCFPPKH